MLKGGARSGRTVVRIPEIPCPAPNHRENLIFADNHKNKMQNFVVTKVAETASCHSAKGVVFAKGESSLRHMPKAQS